MTNTYDWVIAAKEKFEKENSDYEVQLEYIPGNDYPTIIRFIFWKDWQRT